jgi:hypothetical protein
VLVLASFSSGKSTKPFPSSHQLLCLLPSLNICINFSLPSPLLLLALPTSASSSNPSLPLIHPAKELFNLAPTQFQRLLHSMKSHQLASSQIPPLSSPPAPLSKEIPSSSYFPSYLHRRLTYIPNQNISTPEKLWGVHHTVKLRVDLMNCFLCSLPLCSLLFLGGSFIKKNKK